MTDRGGGPGQNAEQTVNGLVQPNANPARDVIPQFVCVLPCTKPPVKYLDRLDGCVSGIHVTREETQDLYMVYSKMADVIMAKDAAAEPSTESGTQVRAPDPCAVCLDPIVPSQTSPMLYLENCGHYYHHDCHLKWRDNGRMFFPTIDHRSKVGRLPLDFIFTQFLTGHGKFGVFLHERHCRRDPRCECGTEQDCAHLLFDCPLLIDIRLQLDAACSNKGFNYTQVALPSIIGEPGLQAHLVDYFYKVHSRLVEWENIYHQNQ